MLGHGAEAWVYAIDNERVLRVLHAGGQAQEVHRRRGLVDELARATPAFALPTVLEVGEIDGRVFAIEQRLKGRSLTEELQSCEDSARAQLIEAHLDTAAALGDLHLTPRGYFGELISDDAIRTSTWRAYLEQRVAANLRESTPDLASIDPAEIAECLPSATNPTFVHLDAFAANMLTDGSRITAVIDVGPTSLSGDRRIDPLAAVVYLASPEITPTATHEDVDVAMSWLRAAGLHDWFAPVQRWIAAYWSTVKEPSVRGWCCDILLRPK
jgi:aminoglycoside phosphotransferase (APT) family kinase protein